MLRVFFLIRTCTSDPGVALLIRGRSEDVSRSGAPCDTKALDLAQALAKRLPCVSSELRPVAFFAESAVLVNSLWGSVVLRFITVNLTLFIVISESQAWKIVHTLLPQSKAWNVVALFSEHGAKSLEEEIP